MLRRFYPVLLLLAVLSVGAAFAQSTSQKDKERAKEKDNRAKAERVVVGDGPGFFAFSFNSERMSYLGVFLEEVSAERMKELGISEERGAIVMKIAQGSPAEKAGLKENDVIVSFNGRRVDSVRELQRLLSETPPGRTVAVEVLRGGNRQTFNVTLSNRSQERAFFPAEGDMTERMKELDGIFKEHGRMLGTYPNFGNFNFGELGSMSLIRGARLGVSVESLTQQLGEYFGVKDGKGVLITHVHEGSAAAKAGLKAGDVIIEADNEAVNDVTGLMNALGRKQEGTVNIKIMRDRSEQTVTVTLEKLEPRTFRRAPGVPVTRFFQTI